MAIKIIDIESAEDEVEDIIQEIAILSELRSSYVTKYYGSYARGAFHHIRVGLRHNLDVGNND